MVEPRQIGTLFEGIEARVVVDHGAAAHAQRARVNRDMLGSTRGHVASATGVHVQRRRHARYNVHQLARSREREQREAVQRTADRQDHRQVQQRIAEHHRIHLADLRAARRKAAQRRPGRPRKATTIPHHRQAGHVVAEDQGDR